MSSLTSLSESGHARLKSFGVFLVGVCLVVASVVVGISAIHYEFVHTDTHDIAPDEMGELVHYEDLSSREQRLVRGAIEGTRYTFPTPGPMPHGGTVASSGTLTVHYEDRYYRFARRPFFNYETTTGLLALALAVTGLLVVIGAIARDVGRRRR